MNLFEELYHIKLPGLDTIDEQENPEAIAHFTDSIGRYHWYVIAGNELCNGDVELFCLVKLLTVEFGMCNLSQLHEIGVTPDKEWKPKGMYDIREELKEREE